MKVILTGSTGFVGKGILNEALSHPSITSIVIISRRLSPELTELIKVNSKVQVVVLEDFMSYPPEVMAQLEGAEACIWAIGKPAMKAASLEEACKVEIDYTRAVALAFSSTLGPALKPKGKAFRFVLCSGMFAQRETDQKLWFLHHTRINKGKMENILLEQSKKEGTNFEVSIMRPGGVVADDAMIPELLVGIISSIRRNCLAAAMVDEAVAGAPGNRTFENADTRRRGLDVLKKGHH